MESRKNHQTSFQELSEIPQIEERIIAIDQDRNSDAPKYKVSAIEDPMCLFELLGGKTEEIETSNWALKYTYDNFIEDSGLEYDAVEAKNWDIKTKSIEHAIETAHWLVIGKSVIKGPNNIELVFEFELCDGYLDSVLSTPYDTDVKRDYGFKFYN